jgi:hypothetical protein
MDGEGDKILKMVRETENIMTAFDIDADRLKSKHNLLVL